MASLPALRQAIADALNDITTSTGSVLTAYATFPPSYSFPCVVVGPHTKGAVETFEGARRWWFDLHVYTRATDLSYGQNEMDPLLSDEFEGSLEDALNASSLLEFSNLHGFDKPGGRTTIKTNTGDIDILGWTLQLELIT